MIAQEIELCKIVEDNPKITVEEIIKKMRC